MEGYYERVVETLTSAGYRWYETANFCLEPARAVGRDLRARHNLAYWHGRDYLGVGIGAVSTVDGVRRRNAPGLWRGISRRSGTERGRPSELEIVGEATRKRERLLLGLRLDEPLRARRRARRPRPRRPRAPAGRRARECAAKRPGRHPDPDAPGPIPRGWRLGGAHGSRTGLSGASAGGLETTGDDGTIGRRCSFRPENARSCDTSSRSTSPPGSRSDRACSSSAPGSRSRRPRSAASSRSSRRWAS